MGDKFKGKPKLQMPWWVSVIAFFDDLHTFVPSLKCQITWVLWLFFFLPPLKIKFSTNCKYFSGTSAALAWFYQWWCVCASSPLWSRLRWCEMTPGFLFWQSYSQRDEKFWVHWSSGIFCSCNRFKYSAWPLLPAYSQSPSHAPGTKNLSPFLKSIYPQEDIY